MERIPETSQDHHGTNVNGSGESEHYKLCLTALQRASNDTEKLISLLVIAKYLKPGKLSESELLCLFNHIGNEFLSRLLIVPEIEPNLEDISSGSMHSIGVNIIHVILKVKPDHLPHYVMVKLFTQISEILTSLRPESDENKLLLDDILSCYQCLLEIYPDRQRLSIILHSSNSIRSLVSILTNPNFGNVEIYLLLCKAFSESDISSKDPESFHKFMFFAALTFKTVQSQQKFDICSQLVNLIQKNEQTLITQSQSCSPSTSTSSSSSSSMFQPPTSTIGANNWLPLITEGLFDILSSRLDKQRRDPAFYLIVALNKVFPLFVWMTCGVEKFEETRCRNFLPLVLRLVCIEICLELRKEDESIDEHLLNACFILVESLINTICAEPGSLEITLKLTPNDIVNLYNSLRETILTVIEFVKNVINDWEELSSNQTTFSIIMGCIRIICFWTLEDLSGIDDKMIDLIPFMVTLLHDQKSFNIVGHFILTSFYEICVNCDDSDPLKRSILSYDIQANVTRFQTMSPFNDQMDKICEAFRNLK
ncbi:uncharacterized protein LOC128395677 [Panonychus citri]|uniref:uncharacterized protein LOC128395677 n=1 Tax=Panonychus citri TaxID=50023 RepID=UPI0023080589|nr:uncharacterized protein LOC128395677 [Panonychus citri]